MGWSGWAWFGTDDADETSALPVRLGRSRMGDLSRCTLVSWGATGLLGAGGSEAEGGDRWQVDVLANHKMNF